MDLIKRKHIRLREYDYTQNNTYFITICAHNRTHLFGEIVGAHLRVRPNNPEKIIERWFVELENKYDNLRIDKYIIMPDHIHVLMYNPGVDDFSGAHTGAPLPEIVKWFKTQTTNEYIRGVKNGLFPPFDKHIWQRNYYEHVIRDEKDYNEKWQYIEENPMRWEIKHNGFKDGD